MAFSVLMISTANGTLISKKVIPIFTPDHNYLSANYPCLFWDGSWVRVIHPLIIHLTTLKYIMDYISKASWLLTRTSQSSSGEFAEFLNICQFLPGDFSSLNLVSAYSWESWIKTKETKDSRSKICQMNCDGAACQTHKKYSM